MTPGSDEDVIWHHLTLHGYKTIEEWAADSDLTYNKGHDQWFTDEGQPVDLEQYLISILEGQVE